MNSIRGATLVQPVCGVFDALSRTRPVRLSGTENRHKAIQKSHAKVGFLRGLRPPFMTVSGNRPLRMMCMSFDTRCNERESKWTQRAKSFLISNGTVQPLNCLQGL